MPVFKKKEAGDDTARAASPISGAEDIRKKVTRLSLATAACAVVAAGAVGFAAIDHTTSANKLAEISGNMSDIVVAVDTIPAGSTITTDMLTVASVPATYISAGATTDPTLVVGHKAIVDIAANSQVRAGEVAGGDAGASLSAKLDDGMKAITIDTSSASAYAQRLLRQGDHCTLYAFSDVTSSGSKTKKKIVVAKDAEIIALDGFTSYADMKASGADAYSAVTFQVTKSQAEKLRAMQDNGINIWPVITAASDVTFDTAAQADDVQATADAAADGDAAGGETASE